MEKIVLSKYIVIVKRSRDFAVYHSLLGNLVLVDAAGNDFINLFKNPVSKDAIVNKYSREYSDNIEKYLKKIKERGFLVNENYDEYDLIKDNMIYRKQNLSRGYLVRALQLVMSNICNFRCKYCFVDNMYNSTERTEHQKSKTNQMMSFDIARKSVEQLIALLKKNGHQYLNIEFFGGEPLTNWKVIKKILETFGNGTKGEVEILYSITTNGSLITKEMSELFKKYGVSIAISFDSPKSTDRVRLDGKSALEILIPKLQILKENNNWVAFNSVISKETIANYDGYGLIDFAKKYGISMIGLILDLDLEFYKDSLNKQEVLDKLWNTYSYSINQGIPMAGYWHQIFNQLIGKQALLFNSGYKTCPATGCKLSVEPEGHVYICKCCSGFIGNINDIDSVLNSTKYADYAMRTYRNDPECVGCEIEGVCSGLCIGSLEKKYNSLYGKETSSCDIFKGITKKLIENLDNKEIEVLYFPNQN